jgi:hypothetical protein
MSLAAISLDGLVPIFETTDKEQAQMNLSRFYSIAQIEYCRNFILKRHFPIHQIFELRIASSKATSRAV